MAISGVGEGANYIASNNAGNRSNRSASSTASSGGVAETAKGIAVGEPNGGGGKPNGASASSGAAGASGTSGTSGTSSASAAAGTSSAAVAVQKSTQQLNISIVQTSLSVSIGSGNDPLALLYKSAINSLNETLAPQFGPDAIQNAASQDNSPEATADRIVKLSTGFFEQYKKQHPGEDEGKLRESFMETIKKGVDQGFKEAREVLGGLKVLSGDIASNIDKTYELVQKGFADFAAAGAKGGGAGGAGGVSGASGATGASGAAASTDGAAQKAG